MSADLTVVIGNGRMGRAIARRLGPSVQLLVADYNAEALEPVAEKMRDDGFTVETAVVDMTSRESVAALARRAAELGRVTRVAHTAGVSPAQAPIPAILAVDLLGVAYVLEEFAAVIAEGGAGVVIASNAGQVYPGVITPEDAHQLDQLPGDELAASPLVSPDRFDDRAVAYQSAKRAAQLRVQAAANAWGERGARINSISPGVISTPMCRAELVGANEWLVRGLIASTAVGRLGSTEEIAATVDFLLGGGSSFITGTDLVVDGGAVAAIMTGAFNPLAP